MASISSLGNAVYINQNTPAIAQPHQETIARAAFQAIINQELFQEKEQTVEETRPAEMTASVHPDGHGNGEGYQPHGEIKEAKPEETPSEEEQTHTPNPVHLLDLRA